MTQDKLIERLREDAAINAKDGGLRVIADLEREAADQLELQARENDRLRAAVRTVAIGVGEFNATCRRCGGCWSRFDTTEHHFDNCLASPPALACVTQPTHATGATARFFMDHGMIHDRKTGRHVHTDDSVEANATADLLKLLLAQPYPAQQTPLPAERDAALKWYGSRAADLARYATMKPPLSNAIEAVMTELMLDGGKRAAIVSQAGEQDQTAQPIKES